MTADTPTFTSILVALTGHPLGAWTFATARVLPTVVLVPAFGLRALPAPTRLALAAALAASALPAVEPLAHLGMGVAATVGFVQGLPVAVTAAASLWVASMVGGLVDELYGGGGNVVLPVTSSRSGPLEALFVLFVCLAFLASGGTSRVIEAVLLNPSDFTGQIQSVVGTLTTGIQLAIAIALPVVIAKLVLQISELLAERAAAPATLQAVAIPLRSVIVLIVVAILLDRTLGLVALVAGRAP